MINREYLLLITLLRWQLEAIINNFAMCRCLFFVRDIYGSLDNIYRVWKSGRVSLAQETLSIRTLEAHYYENVIGHTPEE